MWETLLGGLLAIIGGYAAIRYQLQNVRKQRMDEVTAERKVEINAQAYAHMKRVEGSFLQNTPEQTLEIITKNEEWFFENRLFLPGKFPDYWLAIRRDLHKLIRWAKGSSKSADELSALDKKTEENIALAIDEIYKDMNIERISTIK